MATQATEPPGQMRTAMGTRRGLALLLLAMLVRQRVSVVGALLALATVSFAFSVWQLHTNPSAAFYLLPARFWELMLGALLAVLMVVYIFNFIDRQVLSVFIGPIKQEFGASDTAMGLLSDAVRYNPELLAVLLTTQPVFQEHGRARCRIPREVR